MKRRLFIAGLAVTLLLLALAGWAVHALDPQPHRRGGARTT